MLRNSCGVATVRENCVNYPKERGEHVISFDFMPTISRSTRFGIPGWSVHAESSIYCKYTCLCYIHEPWMSKFFLMNGFFGMGIIMDIAWILQLGIAFWVQLSPNGWGGLIALAIEKKRKSELNTFREEANRPTGGAAPAGGANCCWPQYPLRNQRDERRRTNKTASLKSGVLERQSLRANRFDVLRQAISLECPE